MEACGSFDWYEHTNLTASQFVNHTFEGANVQGCDSVVTLHLTVNNCGTQLATACDSYDWHGFSITSSGTYRDGYDTLMLTIRYSTTGDTTAVACGSYDWYEHLDMTSSQNVEHTFIGGAANGCDNTVTLHLTVNNCSTEEVTSCGSYTWKGNTYASSGTYNVGYDTLMLTVNRTTTGDTTAVVCDGFDWYEHVNMNTSRNVTHTFVGGNANGCDSTVTLHLTVNHCSTTEAMACDSYTWNGIEYNNSGTYVIGADTLLLTVKRSST